MAYTADYSLALGGAFTGLADLRAQLVDTSGSNTGSAVSTGFTEIGNGFYLWHYAAFPDSHRGGVKFYRNSVPGTILAFTSINPEEIENTDVKTSTRSTSTATDAGAGAAAATAIDATIVSGSYTYGDILRLLAAAQGGKTSGATTGTFIIRDVSDTKNAVSATIDTDHNRTAVALDLTP